MADHEARERIAKLEGQVESLRAELRLSLTQLNTLAEFYRDGINRARVAAEQAEAALANPQWTNHPLHVTEDEEDLKWQADNNIISQTELADMLKEQGLDPNITRY